MDSGVRKDVVRRVWLVLCSLECCSFVGVSAINILMAKMYLHSLHVQDTVDESPGHDPSLLLVILIMELGWSALLCPLLCWRRIFQTETRLRLFLVAAFLGDAMWALCIVALLCRGFCILPGFCSCGAYGTVENLHVSVKRFQRLPTLTTNPESNSYPGHHNHLHIVPGPHLVHSLCSGNSSSNAPLRSNCPAF
jgi:hypothetical protein